MSGGPAAPPCTHLDTVAKFFRALGDPTRLRLLEFILRGERTVAECVAEIGVSQPRVSVHLACLADCGYVTVRRDGRRFRYRVDDPRVADLIVAAHSLAADNAGALRDCPRILRLLSCLVTCGDAHGYRYPVHADQVEAFRHHPVAYIAFPFALYGLLWWTVRSWTGRAVHRATFHTSAEGRPSSSGATESETCPQELTARRPKPKTLGRCRSEIAPSAGS